MLSAMVLASCTQSISGPESETQDLMVFSAVASHSIKSKNKSIITTTNYPLDEPFAVEAVHYPNGDESSEGEIFITGETVRYSFEESLWKSDSEYYWPHQGKLVFYSGSPILPNVTLDPLSGVEADWSIPTVDDSQIDLCFARTVEVCDIHPSTVPVVFNHALSQICFKARTIKDYSSSYTEGNFIQANVISIILDSIKIEGALYEGHFTQRPREWDVNPSLRTGYTVFSSPEGLNLKCDRYDNPELELVGTMLMIPQTLSDDVVLKEWHHAVVRSSVTDKSTGAVISNETYTIPRSSEIQINKHCERWIMDFKYTLRLAVGIDEDVSTLAVAVTDWTETKEIILGDE